MDEELKIVLETLQAPCGTTARLPDHPPAAVFFYSPDHGGAHPEQHLAGYTGLM
ncbi:hypothetical protein [Bradyrhizobium sp. RT3a]|uniref:hypothetical protein n=1 Tax=unclassified Bradyrhizobium TaxID=2631580 RepID=UPI003399EFF0